MGRLTDYARNQLRDHIFRTATFAKPTGLYIGLILATKGYWQANTAYVVGDTIVPTNANGRIYTCTTAGTSGGTEPTWPTTEGATANDGAAVFTEASLDIEAGTFTEVSGGGYARVALPPSDTNWTGTVTGQTDNSMQLDFPVPTADWTPNGAVIAAYMLFDAATGGNPLWWTGLLTPRSVMLNDPAPYIPANGAQYTFG